jgi:hypothetical protein
MSVAYRWVRRLVWGTAAVVAGVGCNPASLSYFLFKGDGKAPAAHPLAKDGKKEVTVAVLVAAPAAANDFEFADLDRSLTAAVGRAFEEQGKGEKTKVKVVDAAKLDRFRQTNPGWKAMKAADIGREVGADFVIDASVSAIGLYDPETGRNMFAGRADLDVVVYDAEKGSEFARYNLNVRTDTKFADSVPKGQYKSALIQRIATELSWKHLPHVTDQRVPPMQF